MPSKVFVPGAVERTADRWSVYARETPDGVPHLLIEFQIATKESKDIITKFTVGGRPYYVEMISAHDIRAQQIGQNDKLFPESAIDEWKELTPAMVIRKLFAFKDPRPEKR